MVRTPRKSRSVKVICEQFELEFNSLFAGPKSRQLAREDSRAFGAMIEGRLEKKWKSICKKIGSEPERRAGRKTIYDFASKVDGTFFGFDVKTKDLDKSRYSDGGVCAVGNLLKFLVNDGGVFVIIEVGHEAETGTKRRVLKYIKVAPIHLLPDIAYRIENLGTGQVRLKSIKDIFKQIDWSREMDEFLCIFSDIVIKHYEKVDKVARKRIRLMKDFRDKRYKRSPSL